MTADSRWLWLGLVVLLAWWTWTWWRQHWRGRTGTVTATVQRLLQPRTPDDCPACRRQTITRAENTTTRTLVTPWRTLKSRRGAPKRIDTAGFACPNRTCAYYRITDAQVHALVGDGAHGKCERIQTLRCQACGTTFSTRRDTPLYGLKTSSQRVAEVLTALAEGLDVAAAVRVFGHSEGTLRTWLTRAGEHSATLHNHFCSGLRLAHVQLDEIRTRLRRRAHVLWLWLAVDPISKLIPTLDLRSRTQDAAHAVIHDLRQRLAPAASRSSPVMASTITSTP